MKLKLVFASATAVGLLMGSGAALAAGGGSIYLTQTGNSQSGTIDQSGGTGDTVGRSGAAFIQQNGSGYGSNVLVINQNSGSDSALSNIGALIHSGSGNSVTGWQSGTSNTAEVDQEGNNSSVGLTQSGKGNGPTGVAWFNATPGNLILQDKTANYSSVSLSQTNNVYATNGNAVSIGQGGFNNKITATQTGYNKLWVRQGSSAPDLWSWTAADPDPFDSANTPHSLSTLSNSTITVNQTVAGSNPSGHNYAALGQGNGSGDTITVTQNGAENSADANQIGNGNKFSSTQTNTANSGENFVGGEAGYPDTNSQPITQIGTGNEYDSIQNGTNLSAFGKQVGDYNFLSNTQSGNLNTLYTAQIGDSNQIYSVQSGSLNTETVNQNNSSSYSNVNQSGTGNTATISQ